MDGSEYVLFLLAAGGLVTALFVAPITLIWLTTKVLRQQGENARWTARSLEAIARDVEELQRLVRPSAAPPPGAAVAAQASGTTVTPAPSLADYLKPQTPPVGQGTAAPVARPAGETPPSDAEKRPSQQAVDAVVVGPPPAPPRSVAIPLGSGQPPRGRAAAGAAYRAAEPPRQPSAFEKGARDALGRIWNWLTVGEEHRPAGVSMEYAVASTWLLRLGVLILLVGMGFFLKYSIDNGIIGPIGRVALTVMAGTAMVATGLRLLGEKYHAFGQGLIGGGIAALYFSAFAAYHFHGLITMPVAAAWMILITVAAVGIAVRLNSMLVAMLGILGGYGTPIMLTTGVVDFVGLFSYLLLLGAGVLAVSYWKNWRLLGLVSFAATYLLFFGAMRSYEEALFWSVMPFLTAFFVLFSTMAFLFNLVRRAKSTLLETIALLLNASIYFATSYVLVNDVYGQRWVAAVTLALAAFYVAHVWYFMLRRLLDRELLFSFMGLAAFFLAVTVPLVLLSQWITATWAIQALVILWIAGRLQSQFLRHVAYLLYLIVIGRFLFVDLGQYAHAAEWMRLTPAAYVAMLAGRLLSFAIPIASLAAALGVASRSGDLTATVDRANDMSEWVQQRSAARAAVVAAVAMVFLLAHFELSRTLLFFFPPLRLPVLSLVWVALCAYLLYEYLARPTSVVLALLAIAATGLLVKLVGFDLPSWRLGETFIYAGQAAGYSLLEASMRLIDFAAAILMFYFAFTVLRSGAASATLGKFFGVVALVLLFVFLTLEVNTSLAYYLPNLRAGGVSILWTLFALGLLLGGVWKEVAPLRYAALVLFSVVTAKIFMSDLDQLDQIFRIVAFIVLGVLVLCGSLIYLRYRQTFAVGATAVEDRPQ